jgi:hypothetical protein
VDKELFNRIFNAQRGRQYSFQSGFPVISTILARRDVPEVARSISESVYRTPEEKWRKELERQ